MDNASDRDFLQGTLDVLVLQGLSWGPRHGYAVARWIEETSAGAFQVVDGALYAALHRMEERGWIDAEWGVSDRGRRAKFYRLTTLGRRQLRAQRESWKEYVAAFARVLNARTEPA
ncbi:MAG TPA: PadR family transcriptional regulator [Gemmatimonadaceae bacterium]|nr:PadR family transcriptional regulator [Gemmatimonadaceae bacterium]